LGRLVEGQLAPLQTGQGAGFVFRGAQYRPFLPTRAVRLQLLDLVPQLPVLVANPRQLDLGCGNLPALFTDGGFDQGVVVFDFPDGVVDLTEQGGGQAFDDGHGDSPWCVVVEEEYWRQVILCIRSLRE